MAKKSNKDKSLTNQYIRAIENPDSIGFKNGRWYQSSRSGDDTNSRGFGIDIKYNKGASELAKNRDGKYLTEEEERALRNKHIDYVSNILHRNTPPVAEYPSEIKQAMAKGLLYRGDGVKTIFNNSSLQEAYLYGTDDDFEKAVANYYIDKGLGERVRLHTDFVDSHKPIEDKQIDWFNPAISVPMFSTLPEVEVTAKYPHEQRVIDTMNASNAEFMNRLRNNDRRAIHNQDGSYSTHVLGSADNIVFPAIQDVNSELKDYRGLPWQGTLDKAIQNKDYIEFPTEGDARYFGEHYKKYFPEYFSNQYADGGEMDTPMADKSDAIASAVRNGVTTLEDIRKAWGDYADSGYREDSSYRDNSEDIEDMGNTLDGYDNAYQEEAHEYLKGGYKPSAAIKNRIANWEGSSMQTNRSFAAEAKDFWNAIPSNVKSKLSQQQADALYSYSYNVGAGNFKKRVVPSLERYFNGNGSVEDVQRHMYATRDKDYRGLAKRRAVERAMFAGQRVEDVPSFSYDYSSNSSPYGHKFTVNNNFQTAGYLGPIVNGNSVNNDSINKTNIFLQTLEDEPKLTIAENTPEPRYSSLERLQNIYSMYGMDDYAQEIGKYNSFEGLMFAEGGKKTTDADGVTSSNGQYHVNPADYWAVLGSAENNKPVEVTLMSNKK